MPPIHAQEEDTKFMKMSAEECSKLESRDEKADCYKQIGVDEAGIEKGSEVNTGAEVAKNLITAARVTLTVINMVATKQSGGKSCKSQKLFMASGLVDMASQLFVTFYSKNQMNKMKKEYEDLYISKKSDKAQTQVFEFIIREQQVVIHVAKHQRNAYALNVALYGVSLAMAIFEMTPFGIADACVGAPPKQEKLAEEKPVEKAPTKEPVKEPAAKKDYLKRSSKDYSKHAKGEKADYSNVKSKIKVDKSKSFGTSRDPQISTNKPPTTAPKAPTAAPKAPTPAPKASTMTPKPYKPPPKKPFKIPTYKKPDYSGIKSKINTGLPFIRVPKKELEKIKEFKDIDPLFQVEPDKLSYHDLESNLFNSNDWQSFRQDPFKGEVLTHLRYLERELKSSI